VDKRWQDVYADPSDAHVRGQKKLTAMTDAHKIQIVNLHNEKRASEGASNMHKLVSDISYITSPNCGGKIIEKYMHIK